jgi:hypothetical protein
MRFFVGREMTRWFWVSALGVVLYGAGYIIGTEYRLRHRGAIAYDFLNKTERIPAQTSPTESH